MWGTEGIDTQKKRLRRRGEGREARACGKESLCGKQPSSPGSTVSGANHRSHAWPWVPIALGTIFRPSHLRCLWLEPGGYGWGQVSGWPSGFTVAPWGRGAELWALSLAGQKLQEVAFPGGLAGLCPSSRSCWKSRFLGTLFLNDLPCSARALVVLAVEWEYGPLLRVAPHLSDSCVVTRLA